MRQAWAIQYSVSMWRWKRLSQLGTKTERVLRLFVPQLPWSPRPQNHFQIDVCVKFGMTCDSSLTGWFSWLESITHTQWKVTNGQRHTMKCKSGVQKLDQWNLRPYTQVWRGDCSKWGVWDLYVTNWASLTSWASPLIPQGPQGPRNVALLGTQCTSLSKLLIYV